MISNIAYNSKIKSENKELLERLFHCMELNCKTRLLECIIVYPITRPTIIGDTEALWIISSLLLEDHIIQMDPINPCISIIDPIRIDPKIIDWCKKYRGLNEDQKKYKLAMLSLLHSKYRAL
jgi:hypothetical protein